MFAIELMNIHSFNREKFWRFLTKKLRLENGAKECMCRSRRELSNAYLLAKIGVDTAENEHLEVWGENSIQYSLHSLLATLQLHGELSDASAEALGIALKTSNALTTVRLVGKLSAAARELSVDVAIQRALRQ